MSVRGEALAVARGQARRALGICAVGGCVMSALYCAGAAGAAAARWAIQRTPNPAGAQSSVLSAVSCVSWSACTAVGRFTDFAGAGVTLAERWNGTKWAIQYPRNPAGANPSLLFDVSCPSLKVCIAVGSTTNRAGVTVPLAERWNGATWAIQRAANPPRAIPGAVGYLGGVSCTSTTNCTAVGYSGNSIGTRGAALAESWNGRRWAIERTPRLTGAIASFLSSVSCVSPQYCTAAGFSNRASGIGASLAERWNGTDWAIQRTPNPIGATSVQLSGVSCSSPSACTAVGFFTIITGIEIMIAESWNGANWTIERTLYPNGARFVQLSGVSCASTRACSAVGFFNNVPGIDVTLAERRNRTDWAIQRPPNPAGATSNSLGGVSCRSQRVCTAVGGFTNSDGTGVTLAERSS
jgi:hypothetical protein